MGLNPGIASAYSMPTDDPDDSVCGSARTATTSMYIIRKNSTADTTLEKNPNARQNLVWAARRSIVLIPSCVLIIMQGPYFTRCHLAASSGLRHVQIQIGM